MNQLVIYTSPTCGPCKQLKPALIDLAETNGVPLTVIDASEETKPDFQINGIRAVPTVVYIRNGREYARFTGAMTRSEIQKYFQNWGLLVSQ